MAEVGLDVAVGPQEGDHEAVILPWSGPTSLVDHDPSHSSVVPQRNTSSLRSSPTFPGELKYLEKSAGYPLVDFEQIFEFNLLSVLIVSKERSV